LDGDDRRTRVARREGDRAARRADRRRRGRRRERRRAQRPARGRRCSRRAGTHRARAGAGPMRVALFPSAYAPWVGGVEELTRRLAVELERGGDEVEIWTMRHPRTLPRAEEIGGLR